MTSLRTSTASGNWQDFYKTAMQGGKISDNPIFTGAEGMYNNTLIYKNTRIPTSPSSSVVRRAVFCGAQACNFATAQAGNPNKVDWIEKLFDYDNKLGIATRSIFGMKITRFNSENYAAIVLSTYATASS